MQKKIGLKKITQVDFFRSLLDTLLNAYGNELFKDRIEEVIKLWNEMKIFTKITQIFISFPFSNIYQTIYAQIINIIVSEATPKSLIDFIFSGEDNIINKLLENVLKNYQFFYNSKNESFSPSFANEILNLNTIYNSKNEFIKSVISLEKYEK